MSMHRTLPIQSAFKGCVAKGNKIQYYLDPNDWSKKADGYASGLFANCGFVNLDLSGWDLSKCKTTVNMFQDELQVHKTINFSNCNWTTTPDNSNNMFYKCNILEKIIAKGANPVVQQFLQLRLVIDIPDRVSSNEFILILDDGNYRFNKTSDKWIKVS